MIAFADERPVVVVGPPDAQQQVHWAEIEIPDRVVASGVAALDELYKKYTGIDHRLCALIPAQDAGLYWVDCPNKKVRRHLQRTIPFLLEDRLAADIEKEQTVVLDMPGDKAIAASVSREKLGAYLQVFQALNWMPDILLPEHALWRKTLKNLPALWLHNGHVWYADADQGVCLPSGLFKAWLEAQEALPDVIHACADDESLKDLFLHSLPEPVAGCCQWNEPPAWETLVLAAANAGNGGLLQKEYQPKANWRYAAKRWRWALAAVLMAVVGHSAVLLWENHHLKGQLAEVDKGFNEAFATVNPGGRAVNPQAQLRQMLKQLDQKKASQFMPVFYQLGELLSHFNEIKIRDVQFDASTGRLQGTLQVKDMQMLESLLSASAQSGVRISLNSSSVQNDGLIASVTVTEKQS